MRRIRVLQIISNLSRGGAERMAMNLITSTNREKFDVAVVSLFDRCRSEIEERIDSAGVQVSYLGKRPGPDLRMIPRLRRVIKRFEPDIIHTHGGVLRYVLPAVGPWPTMKMIHTVHTLAEKEVDWLGRILYRFAYRTGAVVPVAIAEKVSDSITNLYGIDDVPLIPNGIPTTEYANSAPNSAVRAEMGVRDDEFICLSVGRLQPVKNHKMLLRSFANAKNRVAISTWLFIVGGGELENELKIEAGRVGIGERVRFLGNRRDVPNLLQAADAFVLSSDWEGNPLCVMEAMAAGKPVIATAVGGVPELVSDQESGLLIPAGDETALADAIVAIASSSALRQKLGSRAAIVAKQRFDASAMARAYEELYLRKLSVPNHATASALR